MHRPPALGLMLILIACAQQVDLPAVKASYAAAKPTIATLADADFAPLAFPSKTAFEIDASSPTFDFGAEGVNYFRAFELPRSDRPYAVTIASYMWNGAKRPPGNGIFYQTITALDGGKKPIGTIKPSTAFWVLQPDLPPHRDIVLNLTPDMGARYIVVYTTRVLIAEGDEHTETVGDGVVTNGNVALIFEGKPESVHTAGMPVGSLSVDVKSGGC